MWYNVVMKMGYKKQILLLSFLTIVGIIVASTIASKNECLEDLFGYTSVIIFITLIPLYFTKEAVYKTWRMFAIVYLPIAIILIAFTKPTGGAAMFAFDREMATITFSVLFLIVSFELIVSKYRRSSGITSYFFWILEVKRI